MALNLEELRFEVDTSKLKEAITQIEALGTAVIELDGIQRQEAKAAREAAVAKREKAKAELDAQKAAEKAAKQSKIVVAATEEEAGSADKLGKLIEKLTFRHQDMAAGFTKGESNVLNQARAFGAMGTSLEPIIVLLQRIGELSKDPFDSSLGSVRSITAEFDRLQERANLVANGISLTTKQLREYSRIANESKGKVLAAGIDMESVEGQRMYNDLLQKGQFEYIKYATAVNQADNEEKSRLATLKEQQRLQNEANATTAQAAKVRAQALQWVTAETQKLEFATSKLAEGLNLGSQNKLYTIQESLKKAGFEGAELETRLQHIKTLLQARQGKSELSNIAKDAREAREHVDHLGRAIGVQLGDVAVSLASGMNPLTVLIQQGDQLRFAVQAAADSGKNLEMAMASALGGIVKSFVQTGQVISGFFVTSIKQVGNALTTAALSSVGATDTLKKLQFQLANSADSGNALYGALSLIANRIPVLIGALAGGLLTVLVALVGVTLKLDAASSNLTKSLVLNHATFVGVGEEATNLAMILSSGTNASFSDAAEVMSAAAKAGGIAASQLKLVSNAAIEMRDYGGVAIEDTVKIFSELGKTPVKSLSELAMKTGVVTQEQIKLVKSFEDSGNSSRAASEAMKIAAKIMNDQAGQMRENLSSLEKITLGWKWALNGVIDSIYGVVEAMFSASTLGEQLSKIREQISSTDNPTKLVVLRAQEVDLLKKIREFQLKPFEQEQNRKKEEERLNLEKIRSEIYKANTKEMTKQQYVASKLSEMFAGVTLSNVPLDALRKATDRFSREWDESNKQSNTELSKTESYIDKIKERLSDLKIGLQGSNVELTKAEKMWLDITNDARWNKVDAVTKQQIKNTIEQADALEKQVKSIEFRNKLEEEYLSFQESESKFYSELEQQNISLELREKLIGKTAKQSEEITEQYKIQAETAKINAKFDEDRVALWEKFEKLMSSSRSPEDILKAQAQWDSEFKAIDDRRKASLEIMYKEVAVKAAEDYYKEFESLRKGIADVIYEALTEGGEAGIKSLGKLIESEINRKIKLQIEASVSSNGATGGSIGSIVNSATDIYSMFKTGNFSGSLASTVSALDSFSSYLNSAGMESVGGAVRSFSNALYSNSAAIEKAMPYLGSLMELSKGNIGGAAGQVVGTYLGSTFGPIGGAIGGEIGKWVGEKVFGDTFVGGLVNKLFGDKPPKDIYLTSRTGKSEYEDNVSSTGAFGTIGLDVVAKRVNANDYKAAFDAIVGLDNAIAATLSASKISDIRTALTRMDSYNKESVPDFTARRLKKITDVIGGAVDKLADQFVGTSQKFIEYVVKLVNVNSLIDKLSELGLQFDSNRKSAITFMSALQDLVGGQENLSALFTSYYSNYYSEAEKAANLTNLLSEQFTALGKQLPDSLSSFKAMMQAAITAGDSKLVAKLLVLQQSFYQLYQIAGGLSDEVKTLFDTLTKSSSDAADAARKLAEDYRNVAATLLETATGIRGAATGNSVSIDYNRALSGAQTGDLASMQSLSELAKAYAVQQTGLAGTREQAIIQSSLIASELESVAGKAIEFASIQDYQAQMYDVSKSILETLREQLENDAIQTQLLAQTVTDKYAQSLGSSSSLDSLRSTIISLGGIPAFANGGAYGGGLALVGEQGPELINFNSGGTVHTAGQTSSLLNSSNEELVSELQALRTEVSMLRIEVRADVEHNAKTARLLDRVIPDGQSVQTTVV